MKFWIKIFLGTMTAFVITFAVGAIFLTEQAFNFNREREIENAVREQSVIMTSVESRITAIEQNYPDIARNAERLSAIIRPLSDYYNPQNVFFALFHENNEIYSGIKYVPDSLLRLDNPQSKNFIDIILGGSRYLFVASQIENYPDLTFVYARDISQIDDFRREISRSFQLISVIVLLTLGVSIYSLLCYMTRPITKLNKITAQIASGDYSKRAQINSSDELGELAESFNVMANSVEENMKRKQQFIDNLSHEMKTPLTAIAGYAEYLQNVNASEEERTIAAGHLHDMVLRLENLSEKLLDLTFLRQTEIDFKPCNAADLFATLENITKATLDIKNDMTTINGDETLLLSMLTNLIENAARASGEDDVITVKAYENIIEVIDTGHGIEQSKIEKITAPFYRVDTSRSRKFGGVGLGLSIVSQIADLHGAKLEIESEPGKGTTVRICFIDS